MRRASVNRLELARDERLAGVIYRTEHISSPADRSMNRGVRLDYTLLDKYSAA